MPYTPIDLAPNVHRNLVRLVRQRIEPILRDVRLMLEFPKEQDQPGFNLVAASALCGVVGGLSRIFWSTTKKDGDGFSEVAKRYAAIEPASALPDAAGFAEKLYRVYRNTLAHAFGLNTQWNKALNRFKIETLNQRHVVVRWNPLPVTEEKLLTLEQLGAWPDGLPATLYFDKGDLKLTVDAFYCGIRRLIKNLAEDTTLTVAALVVLSDWPDTLEPNPFQTTSSTNVVISTRSYGTDASLGPIDVLNPIFETSPQANGDGLQK